MSYHTTDTRCSDSQYTNHLKLKLIDTLVGLATNTDLCMFLEIFANGDIGVISRLLRTEIGTSISPRALIEGDEISMKSEISGLGNDSISIPK